MLKRRYVLPPCSNRLFRKRCTILLRIRTTFRTTTSTHTKHAEKKYYIGSQKRLPKQTRNILVGKEPNLFKTVGLIRMKWTTMTSIIHGQYHCHVLLCQCRTCVHHHPPSSTTPHIANHERLMDVSIHSWK